MATVENKAFLFGRYELRIGGPTEMPKRRSLFRQHFQRLLSILLVLYKERRLDRHRFSFGSGAVFGLLCFGAHLAVSLLAVADARHFDMLAEVAEDHAMIRSTPCNRLTLPSSESRKRASVRRIRMGPETGASTHTQSPFRPDYRSHSSWQNK